jgi:hypothetical protein
MTGEVESYRDPVAGRHLVSGSWRACKCSGTDVFFRTGYLRGILRELNTRPGESASLCFRQCGHTCSSDLTILERTHAADSQPAHDHAFKQ